MIKTLVVLLTVLLFSTGAFVAFTGPGATSREVTVKTVNSMKDDAKVNLEGCLVKQVSEEHYIFRDDTDEIEVEIDDETFRGLTVTIKTKIRIIGKVDKDWNTVTVDVDYLEIVEE